MLQIILTLLIFIILVIPIGRYLYKVADNRRTIADPVCDPIDNGIYKVCAIDKKPMNWKQYVVAILLTNLVMIIIGFLILNVQSFNIFNPNGVHNMKWSLSFNTIISFMTNTDLQHYSGERHLSYLSQTMVITLMMFTSAATGYGACMAFIRGICGKDNLGNFYVDMVRVTTRVFIPFAILITVILVSQGVPQNFKPNATVQTIEGKYQDIASGPIASLESIKHIGNNGGGFLGANSSTPLENPNIVTNMIELLSMMLMPGAIVIVFGLMYHYRKREKDGQKDENQTWFGEEGRTLFIAMGIIFVIGLGVCFFAESAGNPVLSKLGISQAVGNMEGKEVRFGVAQSSLFTTVTTAFSTGSVNNMHDSLTPLGGMVALLNMMINAVFGGIGAGLISIALYAMLTVFICGLMIGRTPEYLGKKIESNEIKLIVITLILHPLLILGFTAVAVVTKVAVGGVTNPGFHGLTQILYEFSSAAANNGSEFAGLAANNSFWNITTAIVMLLARYIPMIIGIAIAGLLIKKRDVNETIGTLRTNTLTFAIVLSVIVLIFSALTFFPVVSLGPIAEYLTTL